MELKLRGKVALVTGSSRGIGLATAKAFAAEGSRVMLSARSTAQLREAETALRASGAEVTAHAADVGSPDDAAMTRLPSAANALAVANPMPRLEPVTRATLPRSLSSMTQPP